MPGPLDPDIYFSFSLSTFFHCFPLRLCLALPLNEYLFAIIITQLSIRFPLLAGTEWGTACMRIPFQVGDIRMILIFTFENNRKKRRGRRSAEGTGLSPKWCEVHNGRRTFDTFCNKLADLSEGFR
jgi:hypothetical protein